MSARSIQLWVQAAPVAPASLTVQDLAQLLAACKDDNLPEWKLS